MTIVVGHDGSDCGDDAAVLGAQLALATGEDLVVVTRLPGGEPDRGRPRRRRMGGLHARVLAAVEVVDEQAERPAR